MAVPLLEGPPRPGRPIANTAHDAMSLRRWLKRRLKAVLPATASRKVPCRLNRRARRRRTLIARRWGPLTTWRRPAPRSNRPARNPLARLAPVSVVIART